MQHCRVALDSATWLPMKGRLLIYLMSIILRLKQDRSGGASAEHSLLLVFVAIVAALGMLSLGPEIGDYFEVLGNWVPDGEENPPCPFGGCPDP